MSEPQVGIRISQQRNEQAKRYKSYVLLTKGRELKMKEAIDELIGIGFNTVPFPPELTEQPQSEPRKKK